MLRAAQTFMLGPAWGRTELSLSSSTSPLRLEHGRARGNEPTIWHQELGVKTGGVSGRFFHRRRPNRFGFILLNDN